MEVDMLRSAVEDLGQGLLSINGDSIVIAVHLTTIKLHLTTIKLHSFIMKTDLYLLPGVE